MGERLRVVFLHRAAHARSGSKIMRCDQLAEIARVHLGDKYNFEVTSLPRVAQRRETLRVLKELKGAIVIILKRAYATFLPDQADQLRQVARRVFIDHVDAGFDELSLDAADLHISASIDGLSGMARIANRLAPEREIPFALLLHHPDPRITWRDRSNDIAIRVGYFGQPEHAVIPSSQADQISVHGYGDNGDALPMIEAMSDFNVHYAIRPNVRVRNSWKPFTKGINSAASGSVVLVQRGVEDAIELLGDDYPFLLDGANDDEITRGMTCLAASPGSSDWAIALDRMAALRDRTRPERTADDLEDILMQAA